MRIRGLSFLCLFALGHLGVKAQQHLPSYYNAVVHDYEDSLRVLKSNYYSRSGKAKKQKQNTLKTIDYAPLFLPVVFRHGQVGQLLSICDNEYGQNIDNQIIGTSIFNIYLKRPDLVTLSEKQLKKFQPTAQSTPHAMDTDLDFVETIAPEISDPVVSEPVEVLVRKPNFWKFSGDYYLQFLQNYVSANWHKGGESSYSMVASATIQANYNNKQKLKWDNKLELKFGLTKSHGDSLHSFKTSEDLIRLTSKFGLQASKRWYYTLQLVAYTQFAHGYKSNDPFVYSDFMSPFNANLSLGMDYTVEAMDKKLTGTVHIAPIALNFRYVDRLELGPRYSIANGRHTLLDCGSEFTLDLLWKFTDNIRWQTRMSGYTTYKRVELEWENTFTFKFNKYISTNLFVYPRFDDGTLNKDAHHGYWQLKEYASLGFAYSF